MDNFAYVKITLWIALAIGILLAIALVVYQFTKAGSGISNALKSVHDYIFGADVVVPKQLQDFMNQPSNQPDGYVPWVPTVEEDESYPPAWLKKGGAT